MPTRLVLPRSESAPRIGIVEDEGITGDVLAAVCAREFGAQVVVRQTLGRVGLAGLLEHKPDLALLDICLPDFDGLDVAAEIRRELPRTRVMALSALRDPLTFLRVRELGLHGFVDKREQSVTVLKTAIAAVLEGPLKPRFADSVFTPDALAAEGVR